MPNIYQQIKSIDTIPELRALYRSTIPKMEALKLDIAALEQELVNNREALRAKREEAEGGLNKEHVRQAFIQRLGELQLDRLEGE